MTAVPTRLGTARKVLVVAFAALALAGIVGILSGHLATLHHLVSLFAALHERSPLLSLLAFGALQTVIALCGVLPASAGAIASGIVFGVAEGFLVAGVATLLGSLGAFWLSRGVLRARIHGFLEQRRFLAMLEEMAEEQGWKIVCLMRLSPVLPFAMTSYALGLTGITTSAYLVGTLASLPALLGYVVIGALGASGVSDVSADAASWLRLGLLGLAAVGTLLLVMQFGKVTARYMRSTRKGFVPK